MRILRSLLPQCGTDGRNEPVRHGEKVIREWVAWRNVQNGKRVEYLNIRESR
jgi:hypothetical protein